MKEVILNGSIGDKYGKFWKIKADRISDVFSCIEANYPEFKKDIIELAESGAGFEIQCGDDFIGEEDLIYNIQSDTIVITPIPAGAKSGGAKILAAVAIVAAAFIIGPQFGLAMTKTVGEATVISTFAQATALVAINLAMTGIAQLMAPDPKNDIAEDDKYLFNGPKNTVPQNNVVPVLFGEMIVGGVIIASGTVSGLKNRGYTYTGSSPVNPGIRPINPPSPGPGLDLIFDYLDASGGGFSYGEGII